MVKKDLDELILLCRDDFFLEKYNHYPYVWIASKDTEPKNNRKYMTSGYGNTPREAVEDLLKVLSLHS